MASSRELRVLEALWQNAIQVIEADLFYVVLFNKVSVKLDFPLVAQRIDNNWHRLAQASREYQPDARLPDIIFKNHRPVITGPNVGNWPTYEEKLTLLVNQRPLSWLGVPMLVGNNVIGVIVVENYRLEGAYDSHTYSLIKTMADRVAGALAQTRMIDNLRAVNKVGQALVSSVRMQENEVLEHIFQQARQLMNTDNMYIALLDAERRMLYFPLARENGEPEPLPSRQVDLKDITKGGFTEIVLRSKQPLLVTNVEDYCRENDLTLPIPPIPKSWLGVPMVYGNQILGIISLRNHEITNLYGPDDQEVLQTMAGQAAVAIENARLYTNLDRMVQDRTKRLAALLKVGQSFNSAIRLKQQDMLELIAGQIGSVMDARNMYIALYNQNQKILDFPIARVNGKPELFASREIDLEASNKGGLTEAVIRTREPLSVADVEGWCKENKVALPIPPVPKSWIGIPIMLEDKIFGIISLQSDEFENAYSAEDLEVLQTMAGQAAVAIENARLLEQEEQLRKREQQRSAQLAALQKVSISIISELDYHKVLGVIADHINQLMSASFCTLFSYDAIKDCFEKGVRRGNIHEDNPEPPSNSGLGASLIKGAKIQFIEDVNACDNTDIQRSTFIRENAISSFAGVPLHHQGEAVGVLYVNFLEPRKFSEEDKEILSLFANQASVAISNSRAHDRLEDIVKRRTQELIEVRRKVEATDKLTLIGQVGTGFAHRVNNMVSTIDGRVSYVRRALVDVIPDDDKVFRILDGISEDISLLTDMADKLRGVARPSDPKVFKIITAVSNALRIVRRAWADFDEKYLVHEHYEAELDEVYGDEGRFVSIIENLLRNSVEAMPHHGEIMIETCNRNVDNKSVMELTISDNGPGIAKEQREHLFDLFFTTKEKGMGFGLWSDRMYIESIGGDIQVSDKLGGTTFTIILPAV